jgi:KUP system potassium uptake protein
LFSYLFHNSSSAIEFFQIPVEQVMEIGIRIEL